MPQKTSKNLSYYIFSCKDPELTEYVEAELKSMPKHPNVALYYEKPPEDRLAYYKEVHGMSEEDVFHAQVHALHDAVEKFFSTNPKCEEVNLIFGANDKNEIELLETTFFRIRNIFIEQKRIEDGIISVEDSKAAEILEDIFQIKDPDLRKSLQKSLLEDINHYEPIKRYLLERIQKQYSCDDTF